LLWLRAVAAATTQALVAARVVQGLSADVLLTEPSGRYPGR
jgi:hypothetical protein